MAIPFARSLTPRIARKPNALNGCNKNWRSRCCAPWHRRITTTCVARLAIIQFLLATRFMADLIRGSLTLRLSGTAQKRAAPYFYVRASILPYGFLYGKVLVFAYGKYSL